MTKIALTFIGGFLIGFVLLWGWNSYSNKTNLNVEPQTTAPTEMEAQETTLAETVTNENIEGAVESTSIDVRDQLAGNFATVAATTLSVDGWIVVHEESEGHITNALGAIRRDAGTYQDVEVPLLRATTAGTRYWVVLYSDDGDRQFSLATDFPLRTSEGSPITSSFQTQ